MRKVVCVTVAVFVFAVSVVALAGDKDDVNRAVGKKVFSLPVANFGKEFYKNITDGDLTTYGEWNKRVKYGYLVIDLGDKDFIDVKDIV